jgi:RNA-directed DNA polymerase
MREELPSWCDVRAVDRAAAACARRKRGRPDAIAFRMRYGEEVLSLAARLQSGRYRPEPGWVLVTEQPKPREIHAAPFRDRVVHHLLHELLEPRFERRFIADSFACRRGKGTHAAALRLQDHLWRASRHGRVRAWGLQMDIRSFFCSIHRPTLLALLSKGFSAEELLAPPPSIWRLLEAVVQHDPSRTAARRGPAESFARVPPAKRLGSRGPEYGLPIGNLTSQFFANVYLDALDQFVKRTLGAKHYVRYVDDFVLIHRDPAVLWAWEKEIRSFLSRRLRLELHPVAALLEAARGIDFVGYIVRPRYLLPRRRVVKAMEWRGSSTGRRGRWPIELWSRVLESSSPELARWRVRARSRRSNCEPWRRCARSGEAIKGIWCMRMPGGCCAGTGSCIQSRVPCSP